MVCGGVPLAVGLTAHFYRFPISFCQRRFPPVSCGQSLLAFCWAKQTRRNVVGFCCPAVPALPGIACGMVGTWRCTELLAGAQSCCVNIGCTLTWDGDTSVLGSN